MQCAKCGTELAEGTARCPVCGEWLVVPQQNVTQQIRQPAPPEFPQQEYPQQEYSQQGYPRQGILQQESPQQEYPQESYPRQGYPQQEFPQQGDPQQGRSRQRAANQPDVGAMIKKCWNVVKKYLKSFGELVRWYFVSLIAPGKVPLLSKTNGFEWIPILVLNLFMFAITFSVNINQALDKVGGLFNNNRLLNDISFTLPAGKLFGCNLLVVLVYYVFMYGLSFADVKFLRKSRAPFNAIMSHITVPALPLFVLLLLNLVLGLFGIYVPVFLFMIAFISMLISRANIVKKLCVMKEVPVIDVSVVNGIAILAAGLVLYGLYGKVFKNTFPYSNFISVMKSLL